MISCSDYDYIEIVCMHRYPILLHLKSGHEVIGIAMDTARNNQREECILIEADGNPSLIKLDDIARLDVRVENPHFKTKSFV